MAEPIVPRVICGRLYFHIVDVPVPGVRAPPNAAGARQAVPH